MRIERISLGVLVCVLLGAIALMPDGGSRLQRLFWGSDSRLRGLEAENSRLRAELAARESAPAPGTAPFREYLSAVVYSRYPWIQKNELVVGVGVRENVKEGDAVLFAEDKEWLIGKIKGVFGDASVVQTIFDNEWQSAVRVGVSGAEALLLGGSVPMLTLIDKGAALEPGDVVISVSPEFPHALPIGTVRTISLSRDKLFQEATLSVPYAPQRIQAVLVRKDFLGIRSK